MKLKTLREQLDYDLGGLLTCANAFDAYSSDIPIDEKTGNFILSDGNLSSCISSENDETYRVLQEQQKEAQDDFMESLDAYIKKMIKMEVDKILKP